MSAESAYDKIQRRCSLFLYAFSPTHIKDVCISMATTYETPRIMTINSYPIALTCRFIQLLILIYAFAYIMWYKRGYQDRDPSMISSVTMKVKGIGTFDTYPKTILDNADFIVPPQENNALFIMTNFVVTDQQQTRCGEGWNVLDANCTRDSQCQPNRRFPLKSNGHWTGKCRLPEQRCEMEGWCPVENDLDPPVPTMDTLNYTLFINNFVEFTRFNTVRKNVLNDSQYFRYCRFNLINDKLCPIFRIGDILEIVEKDPNERKLMLRLGAVIRIKIDWMCNLDLGEDECKPLYSFGRLDSRSVDEQFSLGFNFRYASHWKAFNNSHRRLIKAFGLRFIVTVTGDAGRFDLLVLTLNIGSMIGVLGLATVICDIIALYFSDQSYAYRRQKYQSVYLKRIAVNHHKAIHKRRMAKRRGRIREINNYQSEDNTCSI